MKTRVFGGLVTAAAVALVSLGCIEFLGGDGTVDVFRDKELGVLVSGPIEVHAYRSYPYFATAVDGEGKVRSGGMGAHFEVEQVGGEEVEVEAHEIGTSGVYAVGESGLKETHSHTIFNPAIHHFHFHLMHGGLMFGAELEDVDVEPDHADVGTEEVVFYLEDQSGTAPVMTGEVTEGDTLTDIVFVITGSGGTPMTGLTPIIYIAEQGGANAVLGATYDTIASTPLIVEEAGGIYRLSGTTWGAAGAWDITFDIDGVVGTHGDRATWTQPVSAVTP